MCGLAGVIAWNKPVDENVLREMGDMLFHRGPDHGGVIVRQCRDMSVGLAARRLSIVDLSSAGNQPICSENGDIWLVYNGELYNNAELRAELEHCGHSYKSRTDSETIVHAYEEYGTDCFNKLNGMFALALYDARRCEVVFARDRMGVKPLYYWQSSNIVAFASELKSLLLHPDVPREVDICALDLYLSLYYVPSPYCIIRNVHKLAPGHYAIVSQWGLETHPYWLPKLQPRSHAILNEEQVVAETRNIVTDSIQRQMVSDVPIGVLLSGGIDSTIIANVARQHTSSPLHTFSVGYGDAGLVSDAQSVLNDDLRYARIVSRAIGSVHVETIVGVKQPLVDLLPLLVHQLDEPFCESTSFALYGISSLAQQNDIRVLLTGDGSDELFGGYAWYESALRLGRYERIPGLRLAAQAALHLPLSKLFRLKAQEFSAKAYQPATQKYLLTYHLLRRADRHRLINPALTHQLPGNAWEAVVKPFIESEPGSYFTDHLAFADLNLWVRELFNPRLDRTMMMNSVEARVPFQDNAVLDLGLSLPMTLKMRRGQSKYLLRRAFRDMLPLEVLSRPKQAFVGPMELWLRGSLRELALQTLSRARLQKFGLLNIETVPNLVQQTLQHESSEHIPVVWALLVLQLWCEAYLA